MQLELSAFVDALPGLVWTALPDGRAEFLNQRWCEYTGLPMDRAAGLGWQAAIHPEDLPQLLERWGAMLAAGQPGEIEARLRRRDGAYRRFLISTAPITDPSGRVVKWCGINTDIEDRLSEGQRHLADAVTIAQRLSSTGSFVSDLVADEHTWSEELYRIFELDPQTVPTRQAVRNLVHPEDLELYDSVIAHGMADNDIDFEFRIVTPRGALKYLHCAALVSRHITDRPVFMGAVRDVTESHLVEAELKDGEHALNVVRAELAHVGRVLTLGALTASIAHEVNQPLSGIITNASTCLRMLATEPPNVEGARATALRTIRDGKRASDVLQRLREMFARRQPVMEPVDLNEAVREVLALTASELQSSRVILRTQFGDPLPEIRGDRVQLQQVVLNLILNAADAMKEITDRPRNLLLATAREAVDRVKLSVRDSGIGIDPRSVDRLFEAFYTTKTHGMGVGLSISRSIIESHEGRLWATANEGPGATFSFSVPCLTPPRSPRFR